VQIERVLDGVRKAKEGGRRATGTSFELAAQRVSRLQQQQQ
jgi:hypothetical protein